MAQPTVTPPETASSFSAMMAASQMAISEVDLEAQVSRVVLAPTDQPVVKLPPLDTCVTCPNRPQRYPAVLELSSCRAFDDLIEVPSLSCNAPHQAPPRILYGVDLAKGPHEAVRPGFEDLARVTDPTLLTDALMLNRILPTCACAQALFAAADHDLWQGFKLNTLKQVAEQKAAREKPAVRPDPALRRKVRQEKAPRPSPGADLFAAFNQA